MYEPRLESLEHRLLLSASAPTVTLQTNSQTTDTTPRIDVNATDGSGFAMDATFHIDIDLNNDGDFDDVGEFDASVVNALPQSLVQQQSKLLPSDGTLISDWLEFGTSVAISGNIAVVGRTLNTGSSTPAGSVYVYEFDGTHWRETQRIVSEPTGDIGKFGQAIALHGDLLVVGSPNASSTDVPTGGVTFVYERQNDVFELVAQLEFSEKNGDNFGAHIDTDGQTIVIAATGADEQYNSLRGRAHVVEKVNGVWTETAMLTGGAFDPKRHFAVSVAVSDDTIAIGETGPDGFVDIGAGTVHLFERVAGAWTLDSKLHVDDIVVGTGNNFGRQLALDDDTLVVGSDLDEKNRRTLYIFERNNGEWKEVQKFKQGIGPNSALDLSGDFIVYRSSLTSGLRTRINLYQRIGGRWFEAGSYFATDDGRREFGTAVAIDGSVIIASLPQPDAAAYTFKIEDASLTDRVVATLELPELNVGDYQVRARISDAAGFDGVSNGKFFTVNQPSAPLSNVALPTVFSDLVLSHFTTDATPPITVVVDDPDGLAVGDPLFIDLDLNHDGDFDDAGETGFTQGLLAGLPAYDQVASVRSGELFGVDEFGWLVEIDGTHAVVSAPYDPTQGNNAGAVFAYEFINGQWQEIQKIVPSLIQREFGKALALDGDRLVVGAERQNPETDAVYVFEFDGNSWIETDILLTPGDDGENYATAVAIDGDWLFASAVGDSATPGMVFGFKHANGGWNHIETLQASDAINNDRFGLSLDIHGSQLIVGNDGDINDGSGRFIRGAYTFERSGDTWIEDAKLEAPTDFDSSKYAAHVAIENNVAVVSATRGDATSLAGVAYVYEKVDGNWEQTGILRPSPSEFDEFGSSVAIDNGIIVVGSRRNDTNAYDDGAAFVFQKVGAYWVETSHLIGDDVGLEHAFGTAVAIQGGRILVSSNPRHLGDQGFSSGEAYFFDTEPIGAVNPAATVAVNLPTLPDGLFAIRTRLSDVLGNVSATPPQFFTVQQNNVAPTVVSATPNDGASITNSRIDLLLEFSEPVIDFSVDDISLSGAAAAFAIVDEPEFVGANLWRVSIGELVDGALSVDLASDGDGVTDVTGLALAPSSLTFDVSVAPPQVRSLSRDPEAIIDRRYIELLIDFDQVMIGLSGAFASITGSAFANASTFSRQTGASQTRIEIFDLQSGDLQIILAPIAGMLTNQAGKDLAPVVLDYIVEVGPTILSVTPAPDALLNGAINVDVQFSESVIDIDSDDLQIFGEATQNGVVGQPVDMGNNIWRFPITGVSDGVMNVTLAGTLGDVMDAQGHAMQPMSWRYEIDSTPPTFQPIGLNGGFVTNSTLLLRFDFFETVTGMEVSDLAISGSATTNATVQFQSQSQSNRGKWTIFGLVDGDLHVTIAPDSGDITDLAGNDLAPSNLFFTVDVNAPVALSVSPVEDSTLTSTRLDFDVTFSEPVFGLTTDHVFLFSDPSNTAFVDGLVQLDDTTWRFVIRDIDDGDLIVRITPFRGNFFDLAGNAFDGEQGFNYQVMILADTAAPTVHESILIEGGTQRSVISELAVQFSEEIGTLLSPTQLTVENLTDDSFIDPSNLVVEFDPLLNRGVWTFPGLTNGLLPDGNYRVTLSAAGIEDVAANPLSGDTQFEFHRLYGDADGDRDVDNQDLFDFRRASFTQLGDPGFDQRFDSDRDDDIDNADLFAFRSTVFTQLPPPFAPLTSQSELDMAQLLANFDSQLQTENQIEKIAKTPWQDGIQSDDLWFVNLR